MAKNMKTRKGKDGFDYPYTSPDLVVDATGKSASKKFEDINLQFKDIANLSLTKHTDGKVYIKKQDGTLIGDGIEIGGSDVDLSKITMSMSGQTLKLMNNGTQVASVEIPTNTVTDEQLSTAIQAKINDGSLGALSLGYQTISEEQLGFSVNNEKVLLTNLFQNNYSQIENSGVIVNSDSQSRRVAFKEYIDMESLITQYPQLSENGIPCLDITLKDGFKYYVLIKNNADETYSHMNAYGIDSSYRLILKKGYSFAIYTLKVGATVQELKQAVKLELSYIPTNGKITKIDNECEEFELISIGKCYNIGLGTMDNNYLIPVTEINNYYVKFVGSSNVYTTASNIDNMCGVTLFNKDLKRLGSISGTTECINEYAEVLLYHNNNQHIADRILKVIIKSEDVKYITLNSTASFINGTYQMKAYKGKLHDSLYQEKVKKYGLEINGDMQRKIKNYNSKYKNYKGVYERLEDGKPLAFNQSGYSYPLPRNASLQTTYYKGEKGDFYIYADDEMKVLDFSQATKGCIVYFDGTYLTAEPNPFWLDGNNVFQDRYDVFIAGGGSGAIGTAFALKDLGYKVCMIEKLDSLGGTHSNTAIIGQIPSPIGSWYKDILRASIDSCATSVAGTITTAENLDSNFKAGQVSLNASQYGKHTVVNPYWYKRYLLEEFQGKIDVKLNTEVIDNKEINGKIIYATVRNTKTGVIKNIYADYFVDCTADCYLLRANKELGKDYFIGSDSKALYNESAYVDGYIGDKYGINAYEICYYYGNPQYNKLSSDDRISKITDINKIESIPGVVSGTNGNFAICRGYKYFKSTYSAESSLNVMSPDYKCGIPQNWLIDYGYDYTYNNSEKYAKAHYKIQVGNSSSFRGKTDLLAMREGYRMKCDRMLKQTDIETKVTSENLVTEHYVALSTWYADSHAPTGKPATFNASAVKSSWLNGVPYECLIPSCYKNALVACRGFGASHISASAIRLIRTMMSLGYASGKAIQLCLENKLDDVRKVDITQLQTNIGISDLLTEVNARIAELGTH